MNDLGLTIKDYLPIIYATLQTLGLLSTIIYVFIKGTGTSVERIQTAWSMRWMYASILSTFYDQATDIGVLMYWYDLSLAERNKIIDIEHIDMTVLFVSCISVITLARIVSVAIGIVFAKQKFVGMILGLFDLLILARVWAKVTKTKKVIFRFGKNNDEQYIILMLQLCEIVLESMPQIILQSVFLIRTYFDQANIEKDSLTFVFISLIFSVLSVTKKYLKWVQSGNKSAFGSLNCRITDCPVLNIAFVFKYIFYVCNIMSRIVLYSLLWSVVGGVFVPAFFILCFIMFIYFNNKTAEDGAYSIIIFGFLFGDALGVIVDVFFNGDCSENVTIRFIVHSLQNILAFSVILCFSMITTFDCNYNLCADSKVRSIDKNKYVFILIIICAI